MTAMRPLEDEIVEHLRASLDAGELQGSPAWGKPLDLDDGYGDTPAELRLPFKVMKNAGFVPHEVVLMHRAAALRDRLHASPDVPEADAWRRELADLQQAIALRLEHLRLTGTL